MRYYLDTNIVIFALFDSRSLNKKVIDILNDYSNIFYITTTVLTEIVRLIKTEKIENITNTNIKYKRGAKITDPMIAFELISNLGINIVPTNINHIKTYAKLPIWINKDPFDLMIISEAITDNVPLISSEKNFEDYEKEGLDFIFNKR